jgi:hypothetical protein
MYYIENKEILLIDPKQFGLSPRTALGQLSQNHFVIIKDRKSRIIMKDGRQIFEQIRQIKKHTPNSKVSLATNAPVCGKTTKYFNEEKIKIYHLEK